MKQVHGLEALNQQSEGYLTSRVLADFLLQDLQSCRCFIYGRHEDEPVLLAELELQADSLCYEMFDQRIDLTLVGKIIRDDCVPLTYCLCGKRFSVTGRCSMIPRVCGRDWYLGSGYSGRKGDFALQKFMISIKEVLKRVQGAR